MKHVSGSLKSSQTVSEFQFLSDRVFDIFERVSSPLQRLEIYLFAQELRELAQEEVCCYPHTQRTPTDKSARMHDLRRPRLQRSPPAYSP